PGIRCRPPHRSGCRRRRRARRVRRCRHRLAARGIRPVHRPDPSHRMKDAVTEAFVHPYIPNTAPAVKQAMLDAVDAASVEEFYADVPEDLRLRRLLDMPDPLPAEQDLARHVRGVLAQNRSTEERLSFL